MLLACSLDYHMSLAPELYRQSIVKFDFMQAQYVCYYYTKINLKKYMYNIIIIIIFISYKKCFSGWKKIKI